jgi:hypothetical protein
VVVGRWCVFAEPTDPAGARGGRRFPAYSHIREQFLKVAPKVKGREGNI